MRGYTSKIPYDLILLGMHNIKSHMASYCLLSESSKEKPAMELSSVDGEGKEQSGRPRSWVCLLA